MLDTLPTTANEFMDFDWPRIAPYYDELAGRPLTADNVQTWLADWTRLNRLVDESYARLSLATMQDTIDADAEGRYHAFLSDIIPHVEESEEALRQRLLESGLTVPGFEVPLRKMQAQSALFREANLPLLTEERKLATEFDKVIGAQTVTWEGEERTLAQLRPLLVEDDRAVRERAWRLAMERQLADREALNALWRKFLPLRRQLAANAGQPDYRAYRWQDMLRFDYTPEDSARFHAAIEEVVVPAAARLYERRKARLGVDTLRPWDLDVDPLDRPPLRPFEDEARLTSATADMFRRLDPQLGAYFETMRQEDLLDLANRKGKAPGGCCTSFEVEQVPFIFMNAVGLHDDVQTLLHEVGHAFHVFETRDLPYAQQRIVPMEFAEVASMAMELLAAPYLPAQAGGFYTEPEAVRARVEHLEGILTFWPYMAVVDAFQHWAYTHPDAAMDPANCDVEWSALWSRFMLGVDWSGLEQEMESGWHRKLHIFKYPFYYVEYGLAQLGAVQVWANSLQDQTRAIEQYRAALALGGTASLPDLFAAAGAKLAFDAGLLGEAVALVEQTIEALEPA